MFVVNKYHSKGLLNSRYNLHSHSLFVDTKVQVNSETQK